MKPGLHLLARLVILLAWAVACAEPSATVTPPQALVVDVIDGDTIVVRSGPRTETIRLIGIDTPEIAHHGRPAECHGPEAAAHLARLAPPGSVVELSVGREARDIYGRLLAHIATATEPDVAVRLAADGMARPLAIAPNLATADRVADAATAARRAGLGLWGVCPDE